MKDHVNSNIMDLLNDIEIVTSQELKIQLMIINFRYKHIKTNF